MYYLVRRTSRMYPDDTVGAQLSATLRAKPCRTKKLRSTDIWLNRIARQKSIILGFKIGLTTTNSCVDLTITEDYVCLPMVSLFFQEDGV